MAGLKGAVTSSFAVLASQGRGSRGAGRPALTILPEPPSRSYQEDFGPRPTGPAMPVADAECS